MGTGLGIRTAGKDGSGLAVQNPANGDVFPYWGSGRDISAVVVEAFLVDIINGKVRPWDGTDGTVNGDHDEL
jgi:protein disulfide-isomerase A1